jgi:hypothetical protein
MEEEQEEQERGSGMVMVMGWRREWDPGDGDRGKI